MSTFPFTILSVAATLKTLGSAIQKMKTGQNESGNEGDLDSTEGGINSMEGIINSTVTPTVEDIVTDAMQKTAAMCPLGPIAPKVALLTTYSFVASLFETKFAHELVLLLVVHKCFHSL